jgi:hypothetical protein
MIKNAESLSAVKVIVPCAYDGKRLISSLLSLNSNTLIAQTEVRVTAQTSNVRA